MSNLIWLIFIFLIVVLVVSFLWFIWRLRTFSQSHNQTVLDDKLMQSMLGDDGLSKELKSALLGKASGTVQTQTPSSDDRVKKKQGTPIQGAKSDEKK